MDNITAHTNSKCTRIVVENDGTNTAITYDGDLRTLVLDAAYLCGVLCDQWLDMHPSLDTPDGRRELVDTLSNNISASLENYRTNVKPYILAKIPHPPKEQLL